MYIVFFTHPSFLGSKSMPKYAQMIADGMKARNHSVEIWAPKKYFYRLPFPSFSKKWLGYMDQFIVFPVKVMRKLKKYPSQTLFVLADQALGPWMALISKRPHVIHCHDFLAQRSALGKIPENKVGVTGKIYQKLIRNGYRKGENFISISKKTQSDLHRFLKKEPQLSEVVYNGLNQDFKPASVVQSRQLLGNEFELNLNSGYILHIGGNQFYKNRNGVVKIYDAWREITKQKLPLVMIGQKPSNELVDLKNNSAFSSEIHLISNVTDDILQVAYQGASVLLYPSLEEGFGWPIAEAMASGCPVITTARAPMNEVAKESCYYIPRMPGNNQDSAKWVKSSAGVLNQLIDLPEEERQKLIESGLKNAERFDTQKALEHIEGVYNKILKAYQV